MRRAAVGILGALVVLLGIPSPASAGDEEALFGKKRYHSVSVTKDGQPFALVRGTKLRVGFGRGDPHSMGWIAGCNAFGAEFAIEEDVLDVTTTYYTLMGCTRKLLRQDALFQRFFESDPAWSASGRELTLSNERMTIELRRRATG